MVCTFSIQETAIKICEDTRQYFFADLRFVAIFFVCNILLFWFPHQRNRNVMSKLLASSKAIWVKIILEKALFTATEIPSLLPDSLHACAQILD